MIGTTKKLTGKILGASKDAIQELVLANKTKDIPLYNIVGGAFRATVEEGENGMGEYVKLMGKFVGQSLVTGEEKSSGVCILPDVASNMIAGELLGAEEGTKKYIEISLTITAKYDKESVSSYVYGCVFHNGSSKDAFDKLSALIPKQFQLETPKK